MKRLEEVGLNPYIFRPSAELVEVLRTLTPKQRAAIPRLVEQDLQGGSREELFKGEYKICHRSVYFEHWMKNPIFKAALNLALAEARPAVMQTVVMDTVARLREIAPLAADDLERQIVGDVQALEPLMRVASNGKRPNEERVAAIFSMAAIGTRGATERLLLLLDDGDALIRLSAAEAIGKSAPGTDGMRRLADVAVLDRADRETASKAADGELIGDLEELGARRWMQIAPLLSQLEALDVDTDTAAPVPD